MEGRLIQLKQIDKNEAHILNEKFNIPWHDNGISTSRSKHGKKYYLCEHYKNLQALNEIRGVKPCKNKHNFKNKRVGV